MKNKLITLGIFILGVTFGSIVCHKPCNQIATTPVERIIEIPVNRVIEKIIYKDRVLKPKHKKSHKLEVAKTSPPETKKTSDSFTPKTSNFRIRFLGGVGPVGVSLKNDASGLYFSQRYGFVGAVGFDEKISTNLNLELQLQTNKSAFVGLGWDY